MVATGWYVPYYVFNVNTRTPHWTNPAAIQGQADWGAVEGGSGAGHAKSYVSIAAKRYTDRIRSAHYGFTIPKNARINGVTAKIIRVGNTVYDSYVVLKYGGADLYNKAKRKYRSDTLLNVDTYGGNYDKWGASVLIPDLVNSTSFGLIAEFFNNEVSNTRIVEDYVMALNVDFTNPIYDITSDLPVNFIINGRITNRIVLRNTNSVDNKSPIPVTVALTSGLTFVSYSSNEGEYNSETGLWTPILNSNGEAILVLNLDATGAGTQGQVITETEFNTICEESVNVLTSDPGEINYNDYIIVDPATLNHLENGKTYTLSASCKVTDTAITAPSPGIRNNRIEMLNGQSILGGRITQEGAYERVGVTFPYNSLEDLKFRLYNQYRLISTTSIDRWTNFYLIEGTSIEYDEKANLLVNPNAILTDADYSALTLPVGGRSVYTFNVDAPILNSLEPIFQGIELAMDCQNITGLEVQALITSSSGTSSKNPSQIYSSEQGTINFGGPLDLWGLINSDIDDRPLEIQLTFINSGATEITPGFKNLSLSLYYSEDITKGRKGFTWKGSHLKEKNITDSTFEIPCITREVTTFELEKRDGEIILSQDIKKMEFSRDLVLIADNVEDAITQWNEVNTWLSNSRNGIGAPIPEELILDINPTKVYNAVASVEKPEISQKAKFPQFINFKVNFIVPDGVAWDIEPKHSGAVGTNEGAVKVKPTITVRSSGASSIVITENNTGKTLTLNRLVTSGKNVIFDCDARTVIDGDGNNLKTYITPNSNWFTILNGADFDFSFTGATLLDIEFREGS